ncbi:putative Alpha-(1,3)-fucosyltransferase C [Hypsibius exemplaris]|uniref:Fucosyltransferase n=1 Tax=Hypsibius exemplaris TaxID=2072580 RepID=A0A1W0XE40_HYPEX|nr:putative Alpha-(1,3)-fucosyltransferase C [Hypsibius exemplaris]
MSDSNPAKPESPSPSPPSKSKSYWYVCILLSLLSTFFIISTLQDHANIWQPFSPLQTSIQTSEPNSNDEPIPHLFHDKDFILLRPNPNQTYSLEQITPDTTDKLILLYFSAQETVQTLGARQLAACPEHRCAITTNKAHFNRSAAVVFYGTELSCDLPKPQRAFPRQVFIFAMGESPAHGQPCGFMLRKHFFNWTMTYRLDSDIRAHYTYQVPWEEKRRNFAAGKTKLVAWMVSHCKTSSQREKYVAELAKYIPVDVYGACGNLTCGPRGEREAECLSKIREYKFYISFENRVS